MDGNTRMGSLQMKPETLIKLNYYLRFIILIGLILLVTLVLYFGMNHCYKCNFKYEGKSISPSKIWDIYRQKCLSDFGTKDFGLDISNITNFTIT